MKVEDLIGDMTLLQLAADHSHYDMTAEQTSAYLRAAHAFREYYGDLRNVECWLLAIHALWQWTGSQARINREEKLAWSIKYFSKGDQLAENRYLKHFNYTQKSVSRVINLLLYHHVRVCGDSNLRKWMVEPLTDYFCNFEIFGQKCLDETNADRSEYDLKDEVYQVCRQRIRRLKKKYPSAVLQDAAKTLADKVYATDW